MHVVHEVPEREEKVFLLCGVGSPRIFNNVEELCQELQLSFIRENVGRYYGDPIKVVTKPRSGFDYDKELKKWYHRNPEEYFWRYADFIIRTDTGEKLTAKELEPVYWRIRRLKYRAWKNRHGRKAQYCWGGYRSPKTTNERRQAFQNKDEGEPPIRARRNRANLIDAWDDHPAHAEKNWKCQSKRRRQYKLR